MTSKNDENFIAFCEELRAYVEEHKLFPDKHTRLSHYQIYSQEDQWGHAWRVEACDYTKLGADNPAFHCRFYSMEQLYHLIRRSNNVDDLRREIAEVYVSTGTQNFWNELAIRMQTGLGKEIN